MNPIDLIKKYPKYAVLITAAIFIAVFGVVGLVSSMVAAILLAFFTYILTDHDDDWFDPRGPRAV